MKRFLILPLLLIGLLFNGCVNDNDDYDPEYLELGVVYGSTVSNFSIKTDSKLTLYPAEVLPSSYGISDGQRVMVRYTIIEDVENLYMRLYKGGAKGGTVYVDGSRDAQVLTLKKEDKKEIPVQVDIIDLGIELSDKQTPTRQDFSKTPLRSDRQDREIGNEVGNLCPICREGIVQDIGGCHTCTNCNAQLKCGL